jgi:hypothetical protein
MAAKHVSIFDNAMVFYHGGKQRSEDEFEFEFEALSKSSGFSGFHFSGCLPCQQCFGSYGTSRSNKSSTIQSAVLILLLVSLPFKYIKYLTNE